MEQKYQVKIGEKSKVTSPGIYSNQSITISNFPSNVVMTNLSYPINIIGGPNLSNTMTQVNAQYAPQVTWYHTCGLHPHSNYCGLPKHYVVKDQYSTLPIPRCSQVIGNNFDPKFSGLYEDKGFIAWGTNSYQTFTSPTSGYVSGCWPPISSASRSANSTYYFQN